MPVTIDEVTAEVDPGRNTSSVSQVNQKQSSPEIELRRQRELRNYLSIRNARLRAE